MQRRNEAIKQNDMDQWVWVYWPIWSITASICVSKSFLWPGSCLISATQAPQMAFLFSHSLRLQKDPTGQKKTRQVVICVVNVQKIQAIFIKKVLARTIKGQEPRFRRLLHILCIPNGKFAPWYSPSMLRREMRRARMPKTNKKNAWKMTIRAVYFSRNLGSWRS